MTEDKFNQIIKNQENVLSLEQTIIFLVLVMIVLQLCIFTWKLLVYPKLLRLTDANTNLLSLLREVFNSVRWKQDITIDKVERVDNKVTELHPGNSWKPGDPDRRHN